MRVLDFRRDAKTLRRCNKILTQEDLTTPEFQQQLQVMREVLAQDGVGLAAPQIGWNVKLFMLCIDTAGNASPVQVFINPEIHGPSKETEKFQEGCLSFPGLYLDIKRPVSIKWSYYSLDWQFHHETAVGFYARAIQHETDHCNGKVFIDHATSVQMLKVNRWLKS